MSQKRRNSSEIQENDSEDKKQKVLITSDCFLSNNNNNNETSSSAPQNPFCGLWMQLESKIWKILNLKQVNAAHVTELVYEIAAKKCISVASQNMQELLNQYCSNVADSLMGTEGNEEFAALYIKKWNGFLYSIHDISAALNYWKRTNKFAPVVKQALAAWAVNIFHHFKTKINELAPETTCLLDSSEYRLGKEVIGVPEEIKNALSEVSFDGEFIVLFKVPKVATKLEKSTTLEHCQLPKGADIDMDIPNADIEYSEHSYDIYVFSDISVLPTEVVHEIFSYLGNVRDLIHAGQVCKHWYTISRERSLWSAIADQKRVESGLVRLESSDGQQFILGLNQAVQSTTLASILSMKTAIESSSHVIKLSRVPSEVLEKVIQYFHYKERMALPNTQNNNNTGNNNTTQPEFKIDTKFAIDILIASNFLDC